MRNTFFFKAAQFTNTYVFVCSQFASALVHASVLRTVAIPLIRLVWTSSNAIADVYDNSKQLFYAVVEMIRYDLIFATLSHNSDNVKKFAVMLAPKS